MTTAETTLLGTLIAANGSPFARIDVNPSDFTEPWMEALYRRLLGMWSAREHIDLLTATDAVRGAHKTLTPATLSELFAQADIPATADRHAQLVTSDAARRRLKDAADAILENLDRQDVTAAIDEARALVDKAIPSGATTTTEDLATVIDHVIADLAQPPRFTPTPWTDLNQILNGWRPGAMYVIGARPGVGKTALSLNAAMGLTNEGHVLYVSLEMDRKQLAQRLICTATGISQDRLDRRDITPADWERINGARKHLTRNLWIYDANIQHPAAVRSAARTMRRQGKLAGVVVDYIQLMDDGDKKRGRQEIVAAFSRSMKTLAMEFDCPVLVLSQLNRASVTRESKMPSMADLRESGALEQDADVVLLLHRDFEEHPETMAVGVAKNRHGRTGGLELTYAGYKYELRDQ